MKLEFLETYLQEISLKFSVLLSKIFYDDLEFDETNRLIIHIHRCIEICIYYKVVIGSDVTIESHPHTHVV